VGNTHFSDVNVADVVEPLLQIVLVAFEGAWTQRLRRLILQEALRGFGEFQAWGSSVHLDSSCPTRFYELTTTS
jgi:hypothetical protein